MTDHFDDDLRSHFRALRAADDAGAPEFDRLVQPAALQRRSERRRVRRQVASVAVAGLAIVATVSLREVFTPLPDESWGIDLGSVWWHSAPTDFLLDTPGRELLHTVPSLSPTIAAPSAPVAPEALIDTQRRP